MAQLLIRNANVITLDPRRPHVPALAISAGRIAAAGDWAEVQAHAPDAPVLDLEGFTIVPGFIDSHVHLIWTGVQHFALDLRGVTAVGDVQALVAEQAQIPPA